MSPKAPLDLARRPRRLRRSPWMRRLVRETRLSADDLIWPIFLTEGSGRREPVPSLPGVERVSIDEAVKDAARAARLAIPALALFPNTAPESRDGAASEALNPDNLTCRALRAIRAAGAEVGLMTDVALDPFTDHGHDGLMEGGIILNDETVAVLARQAVNHAAAGSDVIAPSDMMDGRVGAIRCALDAAGHPDVAILSYTAKYASCFYGPFRDAVGTNATLTGDKRTYQMAFGNSEEALREAELDIAEGADMLMVKPGLAYLDIVHRMKAETGMPVFAYQVSGEYAMLHAAAERGWLDLEKAMVETLSAFKRAGADGILTYFAPRMAELLARGGA